MINVSIHGFSLLNSQSIIFSNENESVNGMTAKPPEFSNVRYAYDIPSLYGEDKSKHKGKQFHSEACRIYSMKEGVCKSYTLSSKGVADKKK